MTYRSAWSGLDGMAAGLEASTARAVTLAMQDATGQLLDDVRQITESAFRGNRLPKAWRGATYPQGRDSLSATSWVHTKAPRIITAFTHTTSITARNGKWLAIPIGVNGMPGARGPAGAYGLREGAAQSSFARAGNRTAVTPASFERRSGLKLRFVPDRKSGGRRAFLVVDQARLDVRGLARPYSRRGRGSKLYGPSGQTIVVFVLVRQVTLRQRLDLQTLADRGAARVPANLDRHWR